MSKNNIVLILVDDMGYSDIGCFGSEINTPNLDRMAEEGMSFSQMYNNARCCPSRACILTGLYPHLAGIGHMTEETELNSYKGYLNKNCVTIAEALKSNGYKTGISGKWHVGGGVNRFNFKELAGDEKHPTPLQRGFDRFFGTLSGGGSYFYPFGLMSQEEYVDIGPEDEFYYTDAISENAVKMIDEFHCEGKPFFQYVAFTAPHWPLQAYEEDIQKYQGKYKNGWDAVREDRYRKQIEKGIIKSTWKLSPRDDEAMPWENAADKEWEAQRMAVYAAQVESMDRGVGRILDKLKELNIEDDTLVVFLSDNGGCAEVLWHDAGFLNNIVHPTKKGQEMKVGNHPEITPGGEDTFMSYGLAWANASNTPFRYFKHWVHEGGISTPMIVQWGKNIKRPNKVVSQPLHFIDIMATFLDAAGAEYPESYNGNSIIPLEGESFLPLVEGKDWNRERPIVIEHEGNRAVRMGKWKLVKKHPDHWELYDMEEDRTELNDVIGMYPQIAEEMKAVFAEWAQRCGAVEWNVFKKLSKKGNQTI